MMAKILTRSFFFIGAISMIAMSNQYLVADNFRVLQGKEITSSTWYLFTFRTHITLGILAMLLGIFQLSQQIRAKAIKVHRVIGYAYVTAIYLSGIAGLAIAQFAMGGLVSRVGFSILALLWLSTTYQTMRYAIKKNVKQHQKWAYRSYALTFSAITQRMFLLIPLLTDIGFMPIYRLSAWLPWIINLSIAQWLWVKKNRNKQVLSTV